MSLRRLALSTRSVGCMAQLAPRRSSGERQRIGVRPPSRLLAEIVEQRLLLGGEPPTSLDEVGAVPHRPGDRLRSAPACDPAVVAGAEDLGDAPAAELGWS